MRCPGDLRRRNIEGKQIQFRITESEIEGKFVEIGKNLDGSTGDFQNHRRQRHEKRRTGYVRNAILGNEVSAVVDANGDIGIIHIINEQREQFTGARYPKPRSNNQYGQSSCAKGYRVGGKCPLPRKKTKRNLHQTGYK